MFIVATILAVVLSPRALAADCPASCSACGGGRGESEYICQQGNLTFQVNAQTNSYVRIHCDPPELDWAALPLFPISSNGTLDSFTLENCVLPGSFASVLAKFDARDVRLLTLNLPEVPHGELTAERMKGLEAVDSIMMIYAADQRHIPYDVFDALPQLKYFRLRGARLRLEENGGDAVPPHPAPLPHPALRSVELASSGITDVPNGAFLKLSYINKLFLWGNKIENITSDSFKGLSSLDTLDLSKNPITSLPARALVGAPRLRALTLTATKLRDVDSAAFEGLLELQEVLFKFGARSIKFGSRALGALPALKKLTFDYNFLDPLPEDLLDGSTALETLTIIKTGLAALPQRLFRTQQRMKTLNLSGNKIKALDSKIFWPLKALEELNLDDNDIEELPTKLFSGLEKLKSVTAINNGLKFIAADAFQGAVGMERLYLNNNLLTLRPREELDTSDYSELVSARSPFNTLSGLKELHLEGNQISEIFMDWTFDLTVNLKMLNLSRNNLTEITINDVQFLGHDITIDVRHNQITTVDLVDGEPIETLEDTGNVMLLGENPFRCDCDMFVFAKRLHGAKRVSAEPKFDVTNARCASPPDFEGRPLQDVEPSSLTCSLDPQDCPQNCTCQYRRATFAIELDCNSEPSTFPAPDKFSLKITKLRLRSMQSLTLPPHVVSLNLTGLGLKKPPSLNVTQNIQEMDLSQNQLAVAPMELLKANMRLRLAGNPFLCDCSHVESVIALQNYKALIDDADNVTCDGRESVWLKDASRLCDVRNAAIIGGSLAILGILAAIAAALVFRYIHEIKVFMYFRGWFRCLLQEDEIDKDAQYDAFVSFSETDARWVSEQLLPRLEGAPNNFKLCVHYRDWLLGDLIPAQIARSVEQSRRTIVVLSKSFLKSTWAPLEFRAANVRAQRERRRLVLVIVLEDVSDCKEMDSELKAYLTTNTYLKWGDRWFWEKLIYAMPHKKTGHLNEVFIPEKVKSNAIDARLNADGMIVNDAALKF